MDTFQKMEEEVRRRFRFLSYATIIAVSEKTGRSRDRLKEKIVESIEKFALMRTKEMLEKANIALVVLDA